MFVFSCDTPPLYYRKNKSLLNSFLNVFHSKKTSKHLSFRLVRFCKVESVSNYFKVPFETLQRFVFIFSMFGKSCSHEGSMVISYHHSPCNSFMAEFIIEGSGCNFK